MWLSSKRKRNGEESSPPLSPPRKVTQNATDDDTPSDWQASLPLDWTRMGKRGRGVSSGRSQRTGRVRPRVIDDGESSSNEFHGRAIFCLHDSDDPGWIQGYFIPKGSTKPWGMLAVREEVDDCMACCMGGYRRLSLTVYHRGRGQKQDDSQSDNTTVTSTKDAKPNSCKIGGVEWTGGDMISLYNPRCVDMQAEKLLTGEKALPVLHKYFQGLITRLGKECSIQEGTSILDWLPNVAIVMGPMSLTIPNN